MYLMTFLPEEGGHLPSWVAALLPATLASRPGPPEPKRGQKAKPFQPAPENHLP